MWFIPDQNIAYSLWLPFLYHKHKTCCFFLECCHLKFHGDQDIWLEELTRACGLMGGEATVLGLKTEVSWFKKFICTSFCFSSGLTGDASSFWSSTVKYRSNIWNKQSAIRRHSCHRGGHATRSVGGHAPSESVFTVCGSLADFIIAVNVIISVLSSRLQPVHSPLIRRIKCFWKQNKFK